MRKIFNHWLFHVICILLLALIWKIWLITKNVFSFNSDEAIIALMARHILQGQRPIFFYGQAYMGSLDAYLAALSFLIFGQKVLAIRVVQTFLYLLTLITTISIAKNGFRSRRAGLIAAFLLALPAVNTTLYTTVSLGGYGEALLIGNLLLLSGLKISKFLITKEENKKMPGTIVIWVFFLAFLPDLVSG